MNALDAMNFVVLNLGHYTSHHRWQAKSLATPFVRVYYIRKGCAQVYLGDDPLEVRAGFLYLIPPYMEMTYDVNPGTEMFYLFFYGRSGYQELFDQYQLPTMADINDDVLQLLSSCCNDFPHLELRSAEPGTYDSHDSFFEYTQKYKRLSLERKMRLQGLVWTVLAPFMRLAQSRGWASDPRLQNVLDYIQENICHEITIQQLAERACLTKPYLIRLFKREMGIAPLQYITLKRIEQAQLMLVTDDIPIQEIAHTLGFSDASYFVRLFRKHVGFTPNDYRNKLK